MCTVKIIDYLANADLNKKVFNLDFKINDHDAKNNFVLCIFT